MQYLINRLSEKSTWVALGMLGTAIGWKVAPGTWDNIAMIGMGLGGTLGTLLPSRVQQANVTPTAK